MRWPNLLHLSAQLIGLVCLIALFGQCTQADVDVIPSALTLKKGTALRDPVVETDPQKISIIAVNNSYDKLLATAPVSQTRPLTISGYDSKTLNSIVQPIAVSAIQQNEFKWVATGLTNVMVCVFKNVVTVDSKINEISNKADLVWLWTPPKGSIDPGTVTFKEGNTAQFLNNQYTLSPPVLNPGYYVWCVLTWDKQGINIVAASRELPIFISK